MFAFFVEIFLLGLKNLRLHKLRSLLTALGIIFGVAAVIIMVAIGQGSKRAALEQMEQLGAQNILVRSTRPPEAGDATGRTSNMMIYGLTRGDLARLQTLPGLTHVVPLRDTEQKVTRDQIRVAANAIGTTHRIFEVINLPLARGRYFSQVDYDQHNGVCVIGDGVAQKLFPMGDPLGETIQVGTGGMSVAMLTVVGVLERTGLRPGSEGQSMMQRDLDMDVYFPLSLAQSLFSDTIIKRDRGSMETKRIELSEIWLRAADKNQVEMLASLAENVVASQHGKIDYQVKAPIQILRNAERLNRTFNFVMVGIAAMALVVGGIGIMNIMLATVTERTREIGIRRALGAKQRDITLQFLVETTLLSLSGGLLGVLVGGLGAASIPIIVNFFSEQQYPTEITLWSVLVSFLVSGMVGIAFGLYPAVMAARMNPIEALRHE
jgi:putative ABC transport system permease protein